MAAAVVPSHALVNFARLMRSCDDLAADLREEQRRHRLRAYLPVLQALWRELETSAECSWVELDEYGRKVERLVELLDEEKLARGGALAGTRVNSNARLTRKQANEELSSRLTATTRIHEALRAQLMHSMEPAPVPATTSSARAFAPTPQPPVVSAAVAVAGSVCSSTLDALLARAVAEREAAEAVAAPTGGETSCGATPAGSGGHAVGGAAESRVAGGAGSGPREGGGSMGGGPPVREASAAMTAGSGSAERQPRSGRGGGEAIAAQSVEATLDVERKMQDSIVDDASSMVSELRARSIQARKAVRDDLATLDATGELLDQNQAKLDKNNEQLKEQIEQMRASKCVTWVLVLLVCLMFVGTYLLMKLFPKPKR